MSKHQWKPLGRRSDVAQMSFTMSRRREQSCRQTSLSAWCLPTCALLSKTVVLQEAAPEEGAEALASPGKKQRIRSPSPSPEKAETEAADKEQAEPETEQQPQQPQQQEAPKAEQQPPKAEQQPAAAATNGVPTDMPADPTPAEAAGAPLQQQDGEITKLEDVTGVQQVQ